MAEDAGVRVSRWARPARTRSQIAPPRGRRRQAPPNQGSARSSRLTGRVLGGITGSDARHSPGRRVATPWTLTSDHLELVASLIDAGVSVEDAFAMLERTATSRRTRSGAGAVARRIGEGSSISAALEEVAAPPHVVTLVASGERTGRAADALRSAGALTGRMHSIRSTIGRALVYPGVVLAVGVAMLVLIAATVVPQLERTFVELGGQLPRPTRIVIAVSEALRSTWLVAVSATLLLLRQPLRSLLGRFGLTSGVRRLPVVRSLHADVAVTVVAQVVATMLAGGVPFVDALREASRALVVGADRERVLRAAILVEQGRSAFEDDALGALIGPVDREILAVAERTGLLAEQWRRLAERRGKMLDERVTRLGAALEPLLIVFVGAVVGSAVIAMYLPTFRMLDLM